MLLHDFITAHKQDTQSSQDTQLTLNNPIPFLGLEWEDRENRERERGRERQRELCVCVYVCEFAELHRRVF